MRRTIISLVLIIIWSFAFLRSFSQSFIEISATITGTSYGNTVWGDFDNDYDLDAFIVGNSTSRLYRNDGGTSFVYVNTGITGIQYGSCAIGDYDNDGDLDIAITGNAGTKITKIYSNNGSNSFSDIAADLIGVDWSTIAWGDYDNDGRLDLLVSGLNSINEPVARLYHNDGSNIFTDSNISITPCVRGMVKWGDYDNDNLPDILMMGQDFDGNDKTEIYHNDGNNHFVPINANLSDGFRGGIDWGDYDNDGDLDILQAGQICGTQIYRNDGNNTFTNINAGLPSLSYCPAAWGDYNNDGKLDVIIAGNVSSSDNTRLFRNTGSDTFAEVANSFITCRYGSLAWADYDNDGDVDLLITGGLPSFAKIYRNDTSPPFTNTVPTVPSGVQSTVINNGAILKWNLSTDTQTPSAGLSYNVRMGTSGNPIIILSPEADLSTGYLRDASLGNAMKGDTYYIKNLPVGTYYWSVQAVDPNFKGSGFSSTGIFNILDVTTDMNANLIKVEMGYSSWGDYDKDGDQDLLLTGYDDVSLKFVSKIYRNNGGAVSDTINAMLKGVNYGFGAWGDYDNDGYLDILISGATGISPNLNPISKIYRNNGNNTFTDINAGLTGVSHSSGAWGDYDNDGDLDILLAGSGNSTIYRNDGVNVFTNIIANFASVNQGTASWGDYDKDNDLDVLIFATSGTKIYNNNGNGSFSPSAITLPGGSEGSAIWGDYDNDGYPDIFLTGQVSGANSAKIYRNNGSGGFSEINAGIRGVSESHGIWGDFNNDGYSDLLYTGRSGDFITKIYINNKDGTFSDIYAPLAAEYRGKVSTADYDNDGDLDIFITRYDLKPVLYRNNMNFPNDPPESPASLNAENTVEGVVLSWNPSSDTQSSDGGLYYNIRVGTNPLDFNIFTPMVTVPGNKRLLPAAGNAQLNNSWLVKTLPVGTYYWSVQAVDHGYMGGTWAAEESFVVKNVQAFFAFDEVCLGLPTHFTDQSVATKGITSWLWDFGDGNTSALQNPEHIFAGSGTYNVKLTITDTESSTDFIIHSVNVKPKPITSFTAPVICQGTATPFTNITNDNGLTITSWFWDFGDGQTSILKDPPPHGYLGASNYNVTLRAMPDNGCMDEITDAVTVASYPVAGITADAPLTFCSGGSVTLSVPLNASYSYIWKRDGVSITGAESNTYLAQAAGSYTASVTNTIGSCTTVSSAVSVIVNTAPAAPLISPAGPHNFCQGESVVLSVTSTPGYTYQWKLNGGAVGTNSNTYSANASGTYTLVVTNASGCFVNSTNSVAVTVNPKPTVPTVNISGPTAFCEGGNVELSVTTVTGYEYQWENNGSGIIGAIVNSYIAQSSGNYTLRVNNSYGCSAKTENVSVNVLTVPSPPTISSAAATSFCQGDSVLLSVSAVTGYSYQWRLNGGSVGSNSSQHNAKTSGSYDLVVSSSNGCTALSSSPISVTVKPLPLLSTITVKGDEKFCSGESVNLNVPANSDYDYAWKKGTSDLGLSENSIDVTESGEYTVEVSLDGCKLTAEPVSIVVVEKPAKPDIDPGLYTANKCLQEDPVILSVDNIVEGYSYQWYKNETPLGTQTSIEVVEAGTYYLESVSDICRSDRSNLPVTFAPAPPKPVIIPRGPSVWLLSTTSRASAYKWYFNGTSIPEADQSSYLAGQNYGLYRLAVANETGCYSFSDTLRIPTGITGIEDIDPFKDVKIYPNPTTGTFTIEINNNVFGELIIDIFTQNGSKVINIKFDKTTEHFQSQIDLSGQPDGMYLINLAIDKFKAVRKILVE